MYSGWKKSKPVSAKVYGTEVYSFVVMHTFRKYKCGQNIQYGKKRLLNQAVR